MSDALKLFKWFIYIDQRFKVKKLPQKRKD